MLCYNGVKVVGQETSCVDVSTIQSDGIRFTFLIKQIPRIDWIPDLHNSI